MSKLKPPALVPPGCGASTMYLSGDTLYAGGIAPWDVVALPLSGGDSPIVRPAPGFGDILLGLDTGHLYALTVSSTPTDARTLGYTPLSGGVPIPIAPGRARLIGCRRTPS